MLCPGGAHEAGNYRLMDRRSRGLLEVGYDLALELYFVEELILRPSPALLPDCRNFSAPP